MARIVPAKPKMKTDHGVALLTKLQDDIDDAAIIFQNVPSTGSVLCLSPGKLPVLVRCVGSIEGVDLDAQEIAAGGEEIEIPDLMAEAVEIAQRHSLGDIGVIVLSAQDSRRRALPRMPGISEAAVTSDPEEVGQAASVQASKLSVADIEAVLQAISPGASAFEPGTVTKAQLAWRGAQGDGKPAPVTAEVVTAPAQVSTEKFRLNDASPKRVAQLEHMVTSIVGNLAKERDIIAANMPVDPSFVGERDGLLPVLLIAASEKWSPVVARIGRGGFDVRMQRDPQALVGFQVADVLASSPYLLYMPIARVVKSSDTGAELLLDSLFGVFERWVDKHGLGDTRLEEVTVKIATSELEKGAGE